MYFYPKQFELIAETLNQLCSTYAESHPNLPAEEKSSLRALRKVRTQIATLLQKPEKCTLAEYRKIINIMIKAAMPSKQVLLKVSKGFLGLSASYILFPSNLYSVIEYIINQQNNLIAEFELRERKITQKQIMSNSYEKLNDPIEAALSNFITTACLTILMVKKKQTPPYQEAVRREVEPQWVTA